MHPLRALAIEIMAECGLDRSPLAIGKRFMYSDNGCEPHVVEIVGGSYMGEYGISNFWHWRDVLDGKLSEGDQQGYDNGENGRWFAELPNAS